jgi:sarcosine oxidase
MSGLDAEVCVVGLGAVGSMSLWSLARRGVDVLGLEQFWAPHARGASAGESRLLRTLPYLERHPEDEAILEAAPAAWSDLERDSGHDLVVRCGGLIIGPRKAPEMERLVGLAHRRSDIELLDAQQVRIRYPAHCLTDDDIAVLDPAAGLLRPEMSIAAALRTAVSHGARVHTRERVLRWVPEDDAVTVITDTSRYRVGQLVLATGPWASELVPGLPVNPRRLLLTWFMPGDPRSVDWFLPQAFPSFIRADAGVFLYGGPTLDGTMVKVAGLEDWGFPDEPRTLDREVTDRDVAGISAAVTRYFNALDPAPVRAEFHMDGWSDDGTAVVDHLPGHERVVISAGFSGYGFKMAPVIGDIVADLVLNEETTLPVAHMRADRFAGIPPRPR